MDRKKLTFVLACAAAVITLAGCVRATAIYNVNDAAVTASNTSSLSSAQVRSAIIAAGTGLGWRIVDAGPGKLEGTLDLREHTAVATIPYSGRAYSIVYKNSVNLNEAGGTIHSHYNNWVRNLDRAIRAEIARL